MSYFSTKELKRRILHEYVTAESQVDFSLPKEDFSRYHTAHRTDGLADSEACFSDKENRLTDSAVQCELLTDMPNKPGRKPRGKKRPEPESLTVRKTATANVAWGLDLKPSKKVVILGKAIVGASRRAVRLANLRMQPEGGKVRPRDKKRVESVTSRKTACSACR